MKRLSAERLPTGKKPRKTRAKDETHDKQYKYIMKRLSEAFPDLNVDVSEDDDSDDNYPVTEDDMEDIESESDDESASGGETNDESSTYEEKSSGNTPKRLGPDQARTPGEV